MRNRSIILIVALIGIPAESLWPQGSASLLNRALQRQEMIKPQVQKSVSASHPLEEVIDPEQYIVGPGDAFNVTIWDIADGEFQVTVTPEGNLLIPTVGSVDVHDRTLSRARAEIAAAVEEKYAKGEFTITLVALREFKVAVSGTVNKPGTVIVTAMDRISDAIAQAGGFMEKIAVSKSEEHTLVESESRAESMVRTSEVKDRADISIKEASTRNIELKRRDGTVLTADLLSFMDTGENEDNPLLLDGDIIFVPSWDPAVGVVCVYGAVNRPGKYEYKRGDRVSDLLRIAHGLTISADLSSSQLVRFQGATISTSALEIDLAEIVRGNSAKDIPLEADDRLYIRAIPQYHRRYQVTVEGEVQYPGEYAIEKGRTRLSELITLAGGFTGDASLSEASVVRSSIVEEEEEDPELERLLTMRATEMTELEREYFKVKSRERNGIVSVDFQRLFLENDISEDIVLFDNDLIEVPFKSQTVKVLGQVMRSGLVAYKPDADLQHYVREAGGYAWNTRKSKVRLIKGKTGEWMKPGGNAEIEAGDTIFVPERPVRNYWQTVRDVVAVAAQIATVVLVIQNASRN